jgi:hypothetical protein
MRLRGFGILLALCFANVALAEPGPGRSVLDVQQIRADEKGGAS